MPDLPDGCSVRFYRDGDEEKLLALLQEAFGGWPGVDVSVDAIQHLRWKLSSAETARRVHVVAEADSRVVGSRLTVASRMKVEGRVVPSRLGVDLAVHPGFRNMGIMKGMRELSSEAFAGTFDVGYGTTGNPIARKHDVPRGNSPPANAVELLERPLSPGSAHHHENEWTIDQPREFDDRIDEFWREASRPFQLIVARTKDYLNWRYCDPRAGAFTIRLARQREQVLGYTVLRVSRGKAYIADLLALPEREDVVRSLVRDALGNFRRAGVSPVRCWLPSRHPYREELLRQRFVPKRHVIGFRYTAYGGPDGFLKILNDPLAAVHVTIGDTDLV